MKGEWNATGDWAQKFEGVGARSGTTISQTH